jgi:Protein phosphatase 2C
MQHRLWRTAYASSLGTSHLKTGSPCQDAGGCVVVPGADGDELLIAAVSDGAGTAKRSEAGASLAVARFLRDFAGADPRSIDRPFVVGWISSVQGEIAALAAKEGNQVRDYACTMLGAVVSGSNAIYLQIGDGAIVVGGEEVGEYSWIFWPQHGEYANMTNFLTQEQAAETLQFEIGAPIREIALFSDGIERLVLDFSAKAVHSPSFRPIFKWLAATDPSDKRQPAEALIAYLGSDHVNKRTDDDKTLVMATRADPE